MITRTRLAATAVVLTAVLLLSACIPVSFPANWPLSDSAPITAPSNMTYDWFWMQIPSAQLETALNTSGAYNVSGRVCFPSTGWPRYYLAGQTSGGGTWYNTTTAQGCTAYIMLGSLFEIVGQYQFVSFGYQKMAAMGSNETFYVELKLESNGANQTFTIGVDGKVATADQGTTWATF